jgi:hypothetical protein
VTALDGHADNNQILATSVFETADGVQHRLGDVALFADLGGRPYIDASGFDLTLVQAPLA